MPRSTTAMALRSCFRRSTAASRAKTSITTRPYFVFPRVFWLKSMTDLPSAGPWRLHLPAHVGLQHLEGHGLRYVEVALPCELGTASALAPKRADQGENEKA